MSIEIDLDDPDFSFGLKCKLRTEVNVLTLKERYRVEVEVFHACGMNEIVYGNYIYDREEAIKEQDRVLKDLTDRLGEYFSKNGDHVKIIQIGPPEKDKEERKHS